MTKPLTEMTAAELCQIGERVCHGRDWRWVVMWTYNIHRRFRSAMKKRHVWDEMDLLIQREWDWHLGRKLFDEIRQQSLTGPHATAEDLYLRLGEIVAKSISNASWSPGLYDYHCAWRVPALAIGIANEIGDVELLHHLCNHFSTCANNRCSDRPEKVP